jgi:hypothetical protein
VAERRPPGFNVDLGFYDSEEVLSIPRKIRAAAVGVWALCGSYSANKLSDGYVSTEALRDRGCTPAIRAALMATRPEPLWTDAHAGGIQFTRWAKWQRTSEEVKAYRDADAERKRRAREAKKAASTSDDSEMSGRTPDGLSQPVRSDSGTPKAETETKTETKRKTPAPKGANGCRIEPDWMPSQKTIDQMREEFPHLTSEDLNQINVEFIDYWISIPGARGRRSDWDATWRNRVRDISSRRPNGRASSQPVATSDLRIQQAQALKLVPNENRLEIL